MAQQILVIGAGICGLATAVALQRRGHDVTVIEERTDTSSGAGISIWPSALAALDEIGLGDAVRDAGGTTELPGEQDRPPALPRWPVSRAVSSLANHAY